ncbi:MAG: hypothetical protein MUC81_02530 [Bacteroidia bacterium]|jgi:hypothetical protein|nr:hypothetical protein [Bacteroidia bacterium]
MKFIKNTLRYLQWILVTFSGVALISVCVSSFTHSVDISTQGFKNYLVFFSEYYTLFASTFVVISTNLAIDRLDLMADANYTSFKAGNRIAWMQTVKEFISELKESDPLMAKQFIRSLMTTHDYLFQRQYVISSKAQTIEFFNLFKTQVSFFEDMNTKYMNIACYQDINQSYSWEAFRYIVVVMVNLDECYPSFILDLKELYIAEISSRPGIIVNKQTYAVVYEQYLERKRKGTDIK